MSEQENPLPAIIDSITFNCEDVPSVFEQRDRLAARVAEAELKWPASVKHFRRRAEAAEARVAELQAAIRHVVRNSPGTPDSVKGFLVRALEGAWGEPYERAILSTLDSPEWAESPDRSDQ